MSEESPDEIPENRQEPESRFTESDQSSLSRKELYVDQEMADEYRFTPQQAKAMSMYL
jgi:hypothetical protein